MVLQALRERDGLLAGGAQQELERPAHTHPLTLGNDNTTLSTRTDKNRKEIYDAQT
ncbi:hypothetical protein GCM10023191_042800 [Actinoallomurus oryzae]|uniref:Uncharacterized protein n=1 Tax=Actinoallomurus oryzae TaxID=502180 RepID=A0ABP8Q8C3_9ACTN